MRRRTFNGLGRAQGLHSNGNRTRHGFRPATWRQTYRARSNLGTNSTGRARLMGNAPRAGRLKAQARRQSASRQELAQALQHLRCPPATTRESTPPPGEHPLYGGGLSWEGRTFAQRAIAGFPAHIQQEASTTSRRAGRQPGRQPGEPGNLICATLIIKFFFGFFWFLVFVWFCFACILIALLFRRSNKHRA